MRIFLKTISVYLLFLFLLLEVVFRMYLDDTYFQKVDPYSEKHLAHYDYVFIGSSRFEAAIDEDALSVLVSKPVLNTARGFYSPGVSYQALKKALDTNPTLIKGGKVILEYPQFQDAYLANFTSEKYRVWEKGFPMVQFLIPHLDGKELIDFLKYSPNSVKAKVYLISAFHLSVVRNIPVIQEYILDNFIKIKSWNMTQQIVDQQKSEQEPKAIKDYSDSTYANSLIHQFKQLVESYDGQLLLLDVPKHSSFALNFQGDNLEGKSKSARLPVITVTSFGYDDSDFDDGLHLNASRVDEFTAQLSNALLGLENQ